MMGVPRPTRLFGVPVIYRAVVLGAALLSSAACNLLSHTEPAAPTPSDLRWSLSGRIIHVGNGPIAGATLTVLDGSDKGTRSVSDAAGQYAFPSLATGRFHMAIEASGFDSVTPVVDLIRDINVDFALKRSGQ
jgi:hypothetical protein